MIPYTYSEFRRLFEKGEAKDIQVGRSRIIGTYAVPAEGKNIQHFSAVRVEPQVADDFAKRGIPFSGEPEPGLFENFLSRLLPTAGFVLLYSRQYF
jgi:cell division protease FtsH